MRDVGGSPGEPFALVVEFKTCWFAHKDPGKGSSHNRGIFKESGDSKQHCLRPDRRRRQVLRLSHGAGGIGKGKGGEKKISGQKTL